MIEIKNVYKSFDNITAIENINMNIKKGEIHGLIGENGAGKTTIIQCLAGIYKPDSGTIKIDGKPVYDNPEIKSKIGYVADSNSFFPNYKVSEIVSFFSQIYNKTFSVKKFDELNKIFNVSKNKRTIQLSKGTQMRLSLMLALSINPIVLILDEPTSGLDAIAKKQVLDILIDEVEQNNLTILISSHHLSELEKLCDSITILNQSKIIYQSGIDELKSNIKKLQVVFNEPFEIKKEDFPEIIDIEKLGSVYYLVTKDFSNDLINKFKNKGASIIEEVGMSLEEIFIYTNKC